ncbi:VPS9 domain-containing protein 1 isoform X2 [Artibeus jamaicensis]|uniref:VPS9 domain-containing protein 1 isoform X2 n=1 Tax=Artibeus jamaicensis TaxID=9417 RepID=UPI00235A85D6|nr:VPS9 domain-containing protein 1 isoform X2 [Artibeus jamaicensis]
MAAAAGDGAVKPLQCAMKLANGAIELDTGNRPREAYTEYLRSIHYISQVLLEEVETTKEAGEAVPPETLKMLKLAEQCLERAQSTAAKLGKARLKPAMPVAAPVPAPTGRHRRVYSDEGGKLLPFLPPEMFQRLQVVEPQGSKKELTPLEEASLQNQKLKAAYEARVARLDSSQALQKTSLTLSLQRQMMENLVIARAREETLQRKMEERRLRLQEAANRRFCSQVALTPEEREQRALYAAILEYDQDHVSPAGWGGGESRGPGQRMRGHVGLMVLGLPCTPERVSTVRPDLWGAAVARGGRGHPTGGPCAAPGPSILQDWPKHWRAKLKRSPGDLSLVTSLVSHLLSVPDHPISQLLKRLQCTVYRALYPVVSRGAAATSAPSSCSLPPGSRRLRPSQSLHCMLSPLEPSPALRPPDGPPPSPPPAPLQPGLPDRGVDSSPKGPPSPQVGKDSSFEDLEQFLATSERWGQGPGGRPEPQPPEVKEEPLLAQLRGTVKDIHEAIDRLLSLTLLAFEGLNTAVSKDRCLACIEEPFFSPLWPLLLALYRSVHRTREAALSRSMELYRNAPPAALGIPSKLLPPDPESLGASAYPYWAAAQELGLLVLESCPQKKLECIVRALRAICACAEGYHRAQEPVPEAGPPPSSAAIGADDLLPILSFVVLRSGLPQLVSECAALEEFIHEGYLIGEGGYCLTSLQSALSYLELLPQGALGKDRRRVPAEDCPGATCPGALQLLPPP